MHPDTILPSIEGDGHDEGTFDGGTDFTSSFGSGYEFEREGGEGGDGEGEGGDGEGEGVEGANPTNMNTITMHDQDQEGEDMDLHTDTNLDPMDFVHTPQRESEPEMETEIDGAAMMSEAFQGQESQSMGESFGENMDEGNGQEIINIKAESPSPSPARDMDMDRSMQSEHPQFSPQHQKAKSTENRKQKQKQNSRATGARDAAGSGTGGGTGAILGMLEAQQAQLRMLQDQGGFGLNSPVRVGGGSRNKQVGGSMNDPSYEPITRHKGGKDNPVATASASGARNNPEAGKEVEVEDPNDTTWMHEPPEDDQELSELIILRDHHERKRKQGLITSEETMELYRANKRIGFLRKMEDAKHGKGVVEESLFVEDETGDVREKIIKDHRERRPHSTLVEESARGFSDDEMMETALDDSIGAAGLSEEGLLHLLRNRHGNEEALLLSPTPLPTSRKMKKRPRNAREAFVQAEEDREKARAKAQRKKARKETSSTAKTSSSSKSKGKGKSSKTSKKDQVEYPSNRQMVNGESGHDDISAQIIRGLAATDDISARINDPIYKHEMGPTITGRLRKKDQLAELFANIPSGGEKRKIRNDKNSIKIAAKSFGYAQVRAENGRWKVKGMTSLLYHYQLVGAQWMLTRELAGINPNGGLLADSMGLGKTVQTLACMVGNRPGELDIKRKIVTTLIVLPAAVIKQWQGEIRKHTEPGIFDKVIIYSRAGKYSPQVLASVDIVLVSYTEVMKQFPFPNDSAQRSACNREGFRVWARDKEFGPLHQVDWYRVVLDEAHAIKNNNSRTSLACQHLKSVYRWCLTGTPLLNNVEELFPYLRFLKADYCMDVREFKKYFCDPQDPQCSSRVATLLEFSMLRRTMQSTMLNCPIIKLPEPHPHIEKISFSDEERIIYRITENRFRSILNSYIMRGDAKRNYTMWMVQLLRLRQCTGHPFMMERTIKETWDLTDVKELKNQLSALGSRASLPFYERTKLWVEESAAKQAREGESFGKGSFGSLFSLGKALSTLSQKELLGRLQCGICGDIPLGAVQIETCHEIFCRECLAVHEEETRAEDDVKTCPSCALIYTTSTPLTDLDDELGESFEIESTPMPSPHLNSRQTYNQTRRRNKHRVPENSKGRDAFGFEMYTPYSSWLNQSDQDPNFPLTSSAKVTALKRLLLRGFEEAPMDKVVIYCQFRQLQRIIGRMCNQEKWKFVYYTGDISMEHRAAAEEEFRTNPEIVIMVAGLKCGGLGLNLTTANRVISMDLWWNFGVEQQAFGRIFRIGQEKETHMTRIVVKNSVDMRMLSRQDQKLKDLRAVVDDDQSVVKRKELSMQELSSLFGFLRTDREGELLGVEADYRDEDEEGGVLGRLDGGEGDEGEEEGEGDLEEDLDLDLSGEGVAWDEGDEGDDEVVTKVEENLDEENLYDA